MFEPVETSSDSENDELNMQSCSENNSEDEGSTDDLISSDVCSTTMLERKHENEVHSFPAANDIALEHNAHRDLHTQSLALIPDPTSSGTCALSSDSSSADSQSAIASLLFSGLSGIKKIIPWSSGTDVQELQKSMLMLQEQVEQMRRGLKFLLAS